MIRQANTFWVHVQHDTVILAAGIGHEGKIFRRAQGRETAPLPKI